MSEMYCPYSGKLRFPTPAKARKAAENMMRRNRGIVEHYQCETCKDWHIANATKLIKRKKAKL